MKKLFIILMSIAFSINLQAQTYFNPSQDSSYTASLSSQKTYTENTIKAVFDSITNSGVEFGYPQGGCQNRAQLMSMLLSKKFNIQHCKVWFFSPYDLYPNDKTQFEINDNNQLAPNNIIKWNYHVAPCVLVKKENRVDTVVIDPSLSSTQPLLLNEWLQKMGNYQVGKYTFLDPALYFFITDKGKVITGEFYKYAPDLRYCNDAYRSLTLEKSLSINDLAVYVQKKYLIKIRTSNNPIDVNKYNQLKKVFGNVDVLTAFFGNLSSYCGATVSDNISLKDIFLQYNDLMSDAMGFYVKRLNYWSLKVNALNN